METDNYVVRELWLCQCSILNLVGMSYSGDRRMMEISEGMRNMPSTLCRRNGALTEKSRPFVGSGHEQLSPASNIDDWLEWVQEESRKRLGFSAFVSFHLVRIL